MEAQLRNPDPMTGRPRRSGRRLVIGLTLVAAGLITVALVFMLRSFDPEPHRAVLDELQIPDSWELAHEEIVRNIPPIDAPSRVVRYYLVDAEPTELVRPVNSILAEAGFSTEIRRAPSDWCDSPWHSGQGSAPCPEKVIAPCSTNGPGGPTTCRLYASRGQECVLVTALDRGEAATYFRGMDAFHISDPVRIVVLVSDHYAGRLPCEAARTQP
jgi:hypothetical protein